MEDPKEKGLGWQIKSLRLKPKKQEFLGDHILTIVQKENVSYSLRIPSNCWSPASMIPIPSLVASLQHIQFVTCTESNTILPSQRSKTKLCIKANSLPRNKNDENLMAWSLILSFSEIIFRGYRGRTSVGTSQLITSTGLCHLLTQQNDSSRAGRQPDLPRNETQTTTQHQYFRDISCLPAQWLE